MINLNDILKAANGQLFGEPAANLFTDFCLDPHQAGENLLFVALRTDRGDTHQYIEEAIRNGASGILCVDPPDCDTEGVSVLMVNDTIDALMEWALYTLSKLNVKTIAVTGSSAKSVTVDAITHVLSTRYEVHRGNVDVAGRLAIPLSLAKLTPNHDYAVLKLNPTHPGEMEQMVGAIQPVIGILTNIDCLHPAEFDDCKQYIAEQALLIEYLSPGALAIINYDDDQTRELASHARDDVQVKTIGIDRFGADVLAFNVKVSVDRMGFDLRFDGERYVARWTPILGKHHLYGFLAAVAVAAHCEIEVETALRSLTELESLPGRMRFLEGRNKIMLVDDTYAASYSSTMAALDWLQDAKDENHRTIFVMGDMDDLGENNRFAHRAVGQRAAQVTDIIITQGVQAALIGRAAVDSGKDPLNVRTAYSTQDVVAHLQSFGLNDHDIVLVKGGSAARMEQVVRALLENDADAGKLVRQAQAQVPEMALPTLRPSWIEVDNNILAKNIRTVKEHIGKKVTLMAVVKADAYGHGAVTVARTAVNNGAEYLGVASMAEAVELRDAGIETPILVLSYAPAEAVHQALRLNLTLSVYELEQARLYDRASRLLNGKLKYHVKVDTGMGRLGIFPEDAIKYFRILNTLNNLALEGIYTHFATADEDPTYVEEQLEVFNHVVRPLRASGIHFKYVHAANSPAVIAYKESHFNMVRPGLMLYGLHPSVAIQLPEGIEPCLSWKTTILQVKTLPVGHPVGYGNLYRTRGEESIAVLPVGYADGLRRSPQTWQYVLIHGQRAPLVGRISMEKCTINVSHIPNVAAGDEVVLLGRQGEEAITAEMIAEWLGTINYEVVTNILPRVPRR
jgi:Alr-MurF fusion protein